ncbi:transposase [Streptomyces sp. NPDC050121]|uniref:transposase n=1 Tax=Streptomyces sp. NPDC050121 TaxID=3365601 RepID=UPI00379A0597
MAKKSFPDMAPEQQAAILSMLELKVTITGAIPAVSLSDEQWAKAAPLLPEGRGGTVHRSVEAIFYKARTGKSWPNVLKETGATIQASKHFNTWTSEGTWSRVDAALANVEKISLSRSFSRSGSAR